MKKLLLIMLITCMSLNGMEQVKDHFVRVPADLYSPIFKQASNTDLITSLRFLNSYRLVCRQWNRRLHDKIVLKAFFETLRVNPMTEEQCAAVRTFLAFVLSSENRCRDELIFLKRLCRHLKGRVISLQQLISGNDAPLHVMSSKGALRAVRCLIDLGAAQQQWLDSFGFTPLHRAALKGHVPVLQFLSDLRVQNLAQNGNIAQVRILNDYVRALLTTPINKLGETPLHSAVRMNSLDAVKAFLACGISCDNRNLSNIVEGVNEQFTPLQIAAINGNVEITKCLLENGASQEASDAAGYRSLHLAAANNRTDVVKLLLASGADKEAQTKIGDRALHLAASAGHAEVVNILLKWGANKEAQSSRAIRPIHQAAENGHREVVKILLDWGVDKEAMDENGNTPLCITSRKGYVEIVKILLVFNVKIEDKQAGIKTAPALEIAVDQLALTGKNEYREIMALLQKATRVEPLFFDPIKEHVVCSLQ